MDYILVLAQAALIACTLTLPALAAFSRYRPGLLERLTPAQAVATAFIASSLAAMLWGMAIGALAAKAAPAAPLSQSPLWRWPNLAALAALFAFTAIHRTPLLSYLRSWPQGLKNPLLALSAFTTTWLLLQPWGTMDNALSIAACYDSPNYFIAAENLVRGRGFLLDYYSGGYTTGVLDYLYFTPLLPYLTALCYPVFGINWYALYNYSTLAGTLAIWGAAEYAAGPLPAEKKTKTTLFFICCFALLPYMFA